MQRSILSRARYYSNAVPGSLFQPLKRAFNEFAAMAYDGRYDTIAHLGRGAWFPLDRSPRHLIEQVIVALRPTAAPGPECQGAEWWIRIGKAEDSKQWHFDLDESEAVESGAARHPMWASVIYLSETGGATVVTDQVAAEGRVDRGLSPERPGAALAIPPAANHFVLFPGGLYHCVLPGAPRPRSRRMTLLVNWWDHAPGAYLETRSAPPEPPLLKIIRSQKPGRAESGKLSIQRGAAMRRLLKAGDACQP